MMAYESSANDTSSDVAAAHPILMFFAPMCDDEVLELAVDIQRRGLVSPVVTFKGMLLDGRARLRACQLAGVEATFVEWTPDLPGASATEGPGLWAFHANALTRRLPRLQRRALLSRARKLLEEGRRRDGERPRGIPGAAPSTRAAAAGSGRPAIVAPPVVAPAVVAPATTAPWLVDAPGERRVATAPAATVVARKVSVAPNVPLRASRIRTETLLVTPAMAAQWLDRNVVNRLLSKRVVEAIAWDIRNGKWVLTHQSVAFNLRGDLIDGQHRLRAIVAAGIAVLMRVTYDVDAEYGDPIDTGTARPASEILGISKRAVAICNALALLLARSHAKGSPARVSAIYDLSQDDVEWACRVFSRHRSMTAGVMAAHVFARPVAAHLVDQFAYELVHAHGNDEASPVVVLRRHLERMARKTSSARLDITLATLRSLQAHCEGERMERLQANELGYEYFEARRVEIGL